MWFALLLYDYKTTPVVSGVEEFHKQLNISLINPVVLVELDAQIFQVLSHLNG
jgi:hypothetical protein